MHMFRIQDRVSNQGLVTRVVKGSEGEEKCCRQNWRVRVCRYKEGGGERGYVKSWTLQTPLL